MAKIKVIEPEEAEGLLKEIYDNLNKDRGKIAEVHKIQSLNPYTITAHMDLYKAIMFKNSSLSRLQREIIAVVTSSANDCEYCQVHHAEAVNHFWKDMDRTNLLRKDFNEAGLDITDRLFCAYAKALTVTPTDSVKEMHIEKMKAHGISDKEILDATLVISYFNFVNRIVIALGVELENSPGGYNYD